MGKRVGGGRRRRERTSNEDKNGINREVRGSYLGFLWGPFEGAITPAGLERRQEEDPAILSNFLIANKFHVICPRTSSDRHLLLFFRLQAPEDIAPSFIYYVWHIHELESGSREVRGFDMFSVHLSPGYEWVANWRLLSSLVRISREANKNNRII